MKRVPQRTAIAFMMVLGLLTPVHTASAQDVFISPLIGWNFGGDAGCLQVANCDNNNLSWGVSFGSLGALFGLEEEIAYAPHFFGETPNTSSTTLTVMTNFLLAPNLTVVRPYALVGLGLMKTHMELADPFLQSANDSMFGWNIGGGLMLFLAPHVGLRGDVRYFHSFQDLEIQGLPLPDAKIDFGRAAGALVVTF